MGSGYAQRAMSQKVFDRGVGEIGVQLQWVLRVRQDLSENLAWKPRQLRRTVHLKQVGRG